MRVSQSLAAVAAIVILASAADVHANDTYVFEDMRYSPDPSRDYRVDIHVIDENMQDQHLTYSEKHTFLGVVGGNPPYYFVFGWYNSFQITLESQYVSCYGIVQYQVGDTGPWYNDGQIYGELQ